MSLPYIDDVISQQENSFTKIYFGNTLYINKW